ncbi:MAG: N-formylglutamate amidohydrolase [Planctomycetota bacterium]|jgi:predicted N-formylglutamate amidohydrolase
MKTPPAPLVGENFEVLPGDVSVPMLFTCEHAESALPEAYGTLGLEPAELDSHWGFDPGIGGVYRSAQREVACKAIHGRLSRLLVDLNREPATPQIMRSVIGLGFEGDRHRAVPGNQNLTVEERVERLRRYYRPYHSALNSLGDELVAHHGAALLIVSFHSFTPRFGTEDRNFEIGLLFDDDGRYAEKLRDQLVKAGLRTRLNEPYSGLRGENFSPRIHAHTLGCRQIELELNQGFIAAESVQQEVGVTIATALRHVLIHG